MPLPLLDIKDIPIFNSIVYYREKRDLNSLKRHPLIQLISLQDQTKVINSILLPSSDVLKLHHAVINDNSIHTSVKLIINLYKKIENISNPKDILLIAVLRSGFFTAILLRYIIYKHYHVEVPIAGITPNYIDHIYISRFEKFINSCNKKIVYFLDGWASAGITYNIIKKLWRDLFLNRNFYFAVISNTATLRDKELLYSTKQDILLPWSIALTDNIGLSNYFLHPLKNISTSFYIPKNLRELSNIESIYRKIIDEKLLYKRKIKKSFEDHCCDCTVNDLEELRTQFDIPKKSDIKIGINECVKAFEKGNVSEIFVNPDIDTLHLKVLKKYSGIYKVKLRLIEKLCINRCQCVVIRKCL